MQRFASTSTFVRRTIPSVLFLTTLALWGTGCKALNGLDSPTAPSSSSNNSTSNTSSSAVTMTSYRGSIQINRVGAIGYRVTGTISVTLNKALSPAPSRVRAEWENSMVGGSVNYASLSNRTQFEVTVNQDTVACPNFSNSPTDHLRLIDVDRQVVVARGVFSWSGNISCR